MGMIDVSIYGNLILDKVCRVSQYRHASSNNCTLMTSSPGGIANVAAAIARLNNNLSLTVNSVVGDDIASSITKQWFLDLAEKTDARIDIVLEPSPTHTSEAVIICDTDNNNRGSIVQWGACTELSSLTDHDSRWCHIIYADKLPNLDINSLKEISKKSIISLDLCSDNQTRETKDKILSALPHVDYLFASSEEARCLTGRTTDVGACQEISKHIRLTPIIHNPSGSVFFDRGSNQAKQVSTPILVERGANLSLIHI